MFTTIGSIYKDEKLILKDTKISFVTINTGPRHQNRKGYFKINSLSDIPWGDLYTDYKMVLNNDETFIAQIIGIDDQKLLVEFYEN